MSRTPVHAAVFGALADTVGAAPPGSTSPPSTFREKWDEIAASQDIKPGTQAFSDWSQQRTQAGHERLEELFFQGRSDLHGFQAICERIGIQTRPGTVAACRRAIKENLINIFDLIDAAERGTEVLVWPMEQWGDFGAYTLEKDNCYDLGIAKSSRILRCFLQKLRGRKPAQLGGPFSLRGLPRVYLPPKATVGKPRMHPRSRIIWRPLVADQPPTLVHNNVKEEEMDQEESQDYSDEEEDEDNEDDSDNDSDNKNATERRTINNPIIILDPDPSDAKSSHSASPSDQESIELSAIEPSPPARTPCPIEEPRKKRQRTVVEWLLPAPKPKRMTIWNTPSTPTQAKKTSDLASRPPLPPSPPPPTTTTTTTVIADNEASVCGKRWLRTQTNPRRTTETQSMSSPAVSSSLRTVMSFVVDPDDDQIPPPSAQPF